MALYNGRIDQAADLILKGIEASFEELIKEKLLKAIDPVVSQVARDIAMGTSLRLEEYRQFESPAEVQVTLMFNNAKVQYESPRTVVQTPTGHVIKRSVLGAEDSTVGVD